jgi:protoporphyrinogen oxidase
MKRKILVVGGGIGGMTVAYRLLQKGYEVTVVEKNDNLGGLMGGFSVYGTNLEKAYHHIFKTDKYIIDLIEELGLGKKLKWHESKTALYYDKKVYPFSGAIDLLKFKPLNLIDKLRLGLMKIYLEKENNWQKFEDVLAYQWIEKWCGKRAYEVVWEPLLKGKFSDRYRDISMAWMWARIHTRANSSTNGKEYLGYVEGGFQSIIDELERRVLKLGGKINLQSSIINLQSSITNLKTNKYDFVITSEELKNVDYLGAMTVVFSSKQKLSPYYWHNINDANSPFLAFIEHTNLVGTKRYKGRHIYYLGTYLSQKHRYFEENNQKIYKEFFDYLSKIFPKFDKRKIEKKWIFKFKTAQHIVTTNYQSTISNLQSNKKIIHINFAKIYPEDRGVNYAVREAEKTADLFDCL